MSSSKWKHKLLLLASVFIPLAVSSVFYALSKVSWQDSSVFSEFECGFTSYYFSRHSFSINYFIISLVFLLLDLELCFIMPMFLESVSSFYCILLLMFVLSCFLLSLFLEWGLDKLDWAY